jgi:hypothetical protein
MSAKVELQASRAMQAPLSDVWALACDIPRLPDWVEVTKRMIAYSSPTAALGVTWSERTRTIVLTKTTRWEITEFEPPHRRVHVGDDVPGIQRFVVTMEATALDQSTTDFKYTYRYKPGLGPVGRIVHRVTARRTRDAMERSLARFDGLLK